MKKVIIYAIFFCVCRINAMDCDDLSDIESRPRSSSSSTLSAVGGEQSNAVPLQQLGIHRYQHAGLQGNVVHGVPAPVVHAPVLLPVNNVPRAQDPVGIHAREVKYAFCVGILVGAFCTFNLMLMTHYCDK